MGRAALEHALQTAWSFDELAVYGDLLQAEGDPRGDLVALDLHPAPDDPAWCARRRDLLVGWLGEELAVGAGPLVQHGLVHEARHGSHPTDLLDSPLGSVVRGYAVWGDTERIGRALERLAARPRPWLVRLTVASWGGPPITPKLVAAVIAATPRLAELHVAGLPLFRDFAHPAVRRVFVDDALDVAFARSEIEHATRTSVRHGTGWLVEPRELHQLVELVTRTPDCNQLYAAHRDDFDDPLEVLLARAHAAGIVELDGPVVRIPDAPTANSDETYFVQAHPVGHLRVDTVVEPELDLGSLREHGKLVQRALVQYRIAPRLHRVLVEYVEILQSLADDTGGTKLARQRTLKGLAAPLGHALHALVEARGLAGQSAWPAWESLVLLASRLATLGVTRVELRRT